MNNNISTNPRYIENVQLDPESYLDGDSHATLVDPNFVVQLFGPPSTKLEIDNDIFEPNTFTFPSLLSSEVAQTAKKTSFASAAIHDTLSPTAVFDADESQYIETVLLAPESYLDGDSLATPDFGVQLFEPSNTKMEIDNDIFEPHHFTFPSLLSSEVAQTAKKTSFASAAIHDTLSPTTVFDADESLIIAELLLPQPKKRKKSGNDIFEDNPASDNLLHQRKVSKKNDSKTPIPAKSDINKILETSIPALFPLVQQQHNIPTTKHIEPNVKRRGRKSWLPEDEEILAKAIKKTILEFQNSPESFPSQTSFWEKVRASTGFSKKRSYNTCRDYYTTHRDKFPGDEFNVPEIQYIQSNAWPSKDEKKLADAIKKTILEFQNSPESFPSQKSFWEKVHESTRFGKKTSYITCRRYYTTHRDKFPGDEFNVPEIQHNKPEYFQAKLWPPEDEEKLAEAIKKTILEFHYSPESFPSVNAFWIKVHESTGFGKKRSYITSRDYYTNHRDKFPGDEFNVPEIQYIQSNAWPSEDEKKLADAIKKTILEFHHSPESFPSPKSFWKKVHESTGLDKKRSYISCRDYYTYHRDKFPGDEFNVPEIQQNIPTAFQPKVWPPEDEEKLAAAIKKTISEFHNSPESFPSQRSFWEKVHESTGFDKKTSYISCWEYYKKHRDKFPGDEFNVPEIQYIRSNTWPPEDEEKLAAAIKKTILEFQNSPESFSSVIAFWEKVHESTGFGKKRSYASCHDYYTTHQDKFPGDEFNVPEIQYIQSNAWTSEDEKKLANAIKKTILEFHRSPESFPSINAFWEKVHKSTGFDKKTYISCREYYKKHRDIFPGDEFDVPNIKYIRPNKCK